MWKGEVESPSLAVSIEIELRRSAGFRLPHAMCQV